MNRFTNNHRVYPTMIFADFLSSTAVPPTKIADSTMKNQCRTTSLLLALFANSTAACDGPDEADLRASPMEVADESTPGQDAQRVIDTIEQMTSAFERGDVEGVMATYVPRPTIMFEPGVAITDPDEIRSQFHAFMALGPKYKFGEHEVFISGDNALHITPWQMSATAPDGSPIAQSGLSVAVLRRQANGQWLMVIDDPHGQIQLASTG